MGAQSSTVAWRITTATNAGGPAIAPDGTIYQGTSFGELLAVSPDGSPQWTVPVPYRVNSTPAILLDGRMAFVDEGGNVYVVNPDGSPSWHYVTTWRTLLLLFLGGGTPDPDVLAIGPRMAFEKRPLMDVQIPIGDADCELADRVGCDVEAASNKTSRCIVATAR